MPIQVLKPKFHVEECLAEIKECFDIGWFGMGFKTEQFEDAWRAQYSNYREESVFRHDIF
ncbi:MAG: hypothetical protein IJ521_11700 [Schwartzia sp.]|nr:hypothetical protein [Schwartzia sp. (in: firmicutes)]